MTDTATETGSTAREAAQSAYCLCSVYARATEGAALAGARWLGRGDQDAAHDAAEASMVRSLEQLPIEGKLVLDGHEEPAEGTIGAAGRPSTSRSCRSRAAERSWRGAETVRCR